MFRLPYDFSSDAIPLLPSSAGREVTLHGFIVLRRCGDHTSSKRWRFVAAVVQSLSHV